MTKPPKKKPKPEEIEVESDAWERFDQAVDSAIKSGPKPMKGKRGDDENTNAE